MNAIDHTLVSIQTRTTYTERKIVKDGVTVVIIGRCANLVDMRLPVVEIYTKNSTWVNPTIDPEAEGHLNAAFEQLITKGERFYTALRANWALPMVEWTLT